MIKVFGIRHHGPGSAKSLLKGLEAFEPDCVIIEVPADAGGIIKYVENEELIPPVAILIYNKKDFSQANYFPFSNFSPEWQAIKYGQKQGISIQFMDLPAAMSFFRETEKAEDMQLTFEIETENIEDRILRNDPLKHFAQLAGYSDSERWWEDYFEKRDNEIDIFDSIIKLMKALRDEKKYVENRETLLREAYMRKVIRKAEKDGFEKIAVVCGAYHAPVLFEIKNYKANKDNAILRGKKKVPVATTWIPWSYKRLSFRSGYGAGIISPAWYELLFTGRKDITTYWMSKVAWLLRNEDLDASPAHVMSAVILANTLATMREMVIPGIRELKDAAITVFCEGDEISMQLIEEKLIIGDKFGKIPSEIPATPLLKDFEKTVKSARLTREQETPGIIEKKLDLRKQTNLLASHLLYRLNILDVNWGTPTEGSKYQTGSFSEHWILEWQPEFIIKIIEAGMWGSTVETASSNFVEEKTKGTNTLPELTALVELVLNAALPKAIDKLIKKLKDVSALTKDVFNLMDALPSLANIIRYGNTRKTDISTVEQVVSEIIPRIYISLPHACSSLDDDAAMQVFDKFLATNHAINLLNTEDYTRMWYKAIHIIALSKSAHSILQGLAIRILFDKKIIAQEDAATQMRYSLSKGNKVFDAAFWLQGFLHGSGLLLVYNLSLWKILADWISELEWETFKEILPILRRVFSEFPQPEKEKMMTLVKNKNNLKIEQKSKVEFDSNRVKKVVPIVRMLFGEDD